MQKMQITGDYMNIKEKIIEWQKYYVKNTAGDEVSEIKENKELELVLLVVDDLAGLSPKHDNRDALKIRSQASNCMLSDGDFLKMLNKEIEP